LLQRWGVDNSRYKLVDHNGLDITFEELIDRYLSNPEAAFKESVENNVPPQAWSNNLTEIPNNQIEEKQTRIQRLGIYTCPYCKGEESYYTQRFKTMDQCKEHIDKVHNNNKVAEAARENLSGDEVIGDNKPGPGSIS
jgi:hypothetical protein